MNWPGPTLCCCAKLGRRTSVGGGPGCMFQAALEVPQGGAQCTYKTLSSKINSSSALRRQGFVMSIRKIGTPLGAIRSTEMTWNCFARSLFGRFALPQKISKQNASDMGEGTVAGICHFLLHVEISRWSPCHMSHESMPRFLICCVEV